MKKYTANYTYTNPNFVIQNLVRIQTNADLLPILYVTKNILQRGFPTTLSKYLESHLKKIHILDNFEERFLFATNQIPVWNDTIKGDEEKQFPPTKIEFEGNIIETYNPAKFFFEKLLPKYLGEYAFVQTQILPEVFITEIVETENEGFINQQVDFYFPQAKLVIEIDGSHHDLDPVIKLLDQERDVFLTTKGFKTIRITTKELGNSEYIDKIESIKAHIQLPSFSGLIKNYKKSCEKIEENQLSEEEIKTKLLPTSIIRFQILLIELLTHKYLTFYQDWNFNILAHEDLPDFAELAITDLLIWIDKLWQLKNKQQLKKPNFNIKITNNKTKFKPTTNTVNIDFSLFKRYTDENKISKDVIFVRTDYFDIVKDKNYFRVSTTEPINYHVTDEDKGILEFFLENIFDKPSFREGQFPIISNSLNRKDTIGLLPTGGGKSLCYQLPCLLQPSINFVICPIKSLMDDQNDILQKMLITNVNYINSNLEAEEKREVESNFEKGRYLFVWISPEKFQIPTFREKISALVSNFSIAYAVIDEVHCLSEWGHDFRTSYLNLAKTIDKLSPKDENQEGKIKFIGLTATASVNVLKDIKIEFSRRKQRLEDENIKSLLDYSRKELLFEVLNDNGNKNQKIQELLQELKDKENFTENDEKAGIIFTPNVNGAYGCYNVSNTLNTIYQNKVKWYSGDIPKRDIYDEVTGRKIGKEPVMSRDEFNKYKQKVQKDFKENKYQLLVSTKAFGMGIDKQNIFYTFHYGLPSSVEALYQEAGRAGRWDKRKDENVNKIGKCYVIHSPETHDQKQVELLFHKDTTFMEMKAISDEVGFGGRDIFKQVFLFVQGQNDIQKDFEIILGVIRNYFQEKTKVRIFWNDAYSELQINNDVLQKAIYRLSLLGIVSDWTTNFINHFEVQFNSLTENHIIKSVSDYITKYEPSTDVKKELQKVQQNTILEKAVEYLLNWTFENIAYSRKQSLKTLSDFCTNFNNSDDFKKRIDSYFEFSDTTFILQSIGENPNNIENWFEAFYFYTETDEINENGLKKNVKTYIPSIEDTQRRNREYEMLRDRISRFLEYSRNNNGLNFLSGFVRLALDDYDDSDGKERFESSLSGIKGTFTPVQQKDFLNRLKVLGKHLPEEQKMELCQSVSKYYPEMIEELAEYYDLAYLLNDIYAEKLKKLKTLNRKLYEQLAEI